jgi:hypothetical protein
MRFERGFALRARYGNKAMMLRKVDMGMNDWND